MENKKRITMKEAREIILERYGNIVMKIARVKDANTVKVLFIDRTSITLTYLDLVFMRFLNNNVDILADFSLDEDFNATVCNMHYKDEKIEYGFYITNNADEKILYTSFKLKNIISAKELVERIRLMYILNMLPGYEDIDLSEYAYRA